MKYVHTCYRVLDLDRSLDFYTNKLGLELARKTPSARKPPTPSSPSPAIPSPASSSPSTTTAKSPTPWAKATATSPSPSRIWMLSPRS